MFTHVTSLGCITSPGERFGWAGLSLDKLATDHRLHKRSHNIPQAWVVSAFRMTEAVIKFVSSNGEVRPRGLFNKAQICISP